ncbi:glycosyltransferase [Acidipropionibacterium timonense]|uniref:glycosyltransferase n=1 Tax=Acidipropionibacterium timonense TaxID=2161818 RepID=UPI0010313107|nr:glycosyltransferase [Acidipropionibacterium timonense]
MGHDPIALWVCPVSNLAGVARHILDVASVGVPGWRLVVTAPEGPLLDRLRELGTPVVVLPVEEGTRAAVASLRHTIRALRPRIVHSHLARADFLATMASVGTGVTLVSTEHHIPPDRFMFHATLPSAMVMETAHHVRLRRFSRVIAVSASTKRDMLKWWHTATPITVILNGVDRPPVPPTREPGLRLLSLTRLSPEKSVRTTVRAFAHIAHDHPDATLTIAGTGPEDAHLRHLVTSLGLDDRVAFPGFVDPVEAMANHDVILQPSKSDNCSYTLLDAVAAGMGVAASPVGGNVEILPSQCIADFDGAEALARVAVSQGLDTSVRPHLASAVPTVPQMAHAIANEYRKVLT